jgi:death-on-curing protein
LIAEHGGLDGMRDDNLLLSALARPRNLQAYGAPSLFEMAAALGYGLARSHPATDGNKRIALASIDVFLQLNGWELVAAEPEAVVVIRELAAGEIDEAELARWIEANAQPLHP